MANKLYEETNIAAIATAIRGKNGSSDTYTVSQMATAITNLPSGGFTVPNTMCFALSTFTTLPSGLTFETRTSCAGMFASCFLMTSVPLFDTSSVADTQLMFSNCASLTSVPLFDTSSVTDMTEMFYECYELTTVPQFDMSSVTTLGNMFFGCEHLSNSTLQNIIRSLVGASHYSGTKKLSTIGISQYLAPTCTGFPEWATLSANGWTTGY
jgi:surface protein